MESKNLRIGDKVIFTIKTRLPKRGKSQKELIQLVRQLDRKSPTYDKYFEELKDKYLQKKLTIKTGISEIKDYFGYYNEFDKTLPQMYTLENDMLCEETELERIPHHKEFSELLNQTYQTDSLLTRTGTFYKIDDVIILEHVRSSKNVWLDKTIAEQFNKEEYDDIEKEIRHFLHNDVKNVGFGLELNNSIHKLQNILNGIFE